jgi:hypothetical protein
MVGGEPGTFSHTQCIVATSETIGEESMSASVKLIGLSTNPNMLIPPEYCTGCATTVIPVCSSNPTIAETRKSSTHKVFFSFVLNISNP